MPISKTSKLILSGIGILALGMGIGYYFGKNYSSEKSFIPIKSGEDFVGEFKVTRVIDGDTIEIEGGERVRYIGIDTPETVDAENPVECFGPEATWKNRELTEGKTARLEKDATDRDKYNRLLRYVYVGDTFVNLELVRFGLAKDTAYPPDTVHQGEFLQARQEAQAAKLGLWSACPAN